MLAMDEPEEGAAKPMDQQSLWDDYPFVLDDQKQSTDINYNGDLVRAWLMDMRENEIEYYYPRLTTASCHKINFICKTFGQDFHVFATTVTMMERYNACVTLEEDEIIDPDLILCAVFYMASKMCGSSWVYNISKISQLYCWTSGVPATFNYEERIMNAEQQVLSAINFVLPTHTQVDDLYTVLYGFFHPLELSPPLDELAANVMHFYLIHRRDFCQELGAKYLETWDWEQDIRTLFTNRFLAPLAVIHATLVFSRVRDDRVWERLRQAAAFGRISWDGTERMATLIEAALQDECRADDQLLEQSS